MLTFAAVLADRLRRDPGRPLVTFYDDESGERVELSVTTYANWVAKAGSLLVDELDLERGDRLRIDLPPHWLTPVFLGAAWSAGLVVADTDDPTAVVCGPDRLDRWGAEAGERVVLACSLLPLGVRFAEPVPPGTRERPDENEQRCQHDRDHDRNEREGFELEVRELRALEKDPIGEHARDQRSLGDEQRRERVTDAGQEPEPPRRSGCAGA